MASLIVQFRNGGGSDQLGDEALGVMAKDAFKKLSKEKEGGGTVVTIGNLTVDLSEVAAIRLIEDLPTQ